MLGKPPSAVAVRKSFKSNAAAGAHEIPALVMWTVTLVTAIGMAGLNLVTIFSIDFLVRTKFGVLQATVDSHGLLAGVAALLSITGGLALACTLLIFGLCPEAGGSGAPENKGWLNGNHVQGLFTWRSLGVRAAATILANAAGYPVGREGPTVTMGSNLAYLVTDTLAGRHLKQLVDVRGDTAVNVVDEAQLGVARRVTCAVGGACGMAMIFNAPVGGFLYMFEDMTAAAWPVELTFRSFVGLMTCTILSWFLLECCHTSIREFVVYEWSPLPRPWGWDDIPLVVLLAALVGPFAALHTRLCLTVQAARSRLHHRLQRWQPWPKMAEAVMYALFCALLVAAVSALERCGDASKLHLQATMVRYTCPEGAYNPTASLLLTTSEGAVKRLFCIHNTQSMLWTGKVVALITYTALNIGLTGIAVPSGNFTGTMLIGALIGRIAGSLALLAHGRFAQPGIYAMVGAAAMLSSFKRMSFAVVLFVVTCSNDLAVLPLVMLSTTVSLATSSLFAERGYDEEQMAIKKVPYLAPSMPHCLRLVPAARLCDPLPAEAILPSTAPVALVRAALQCKAVSLFPVVGLDRLGGARCTGFVPRQRLEAALEALGGGGRAGGNDAGGGAEGCRPAAAAVCADSGGTGGLCLPVARLANPVPFLIPDTALAPLFYSLFALANTGAACVVNEAGLFVGMISRGGLIEACSRLEGEHDDVAVEPSDMSSRSGDNLHSTEVDWEEGVQAGAHL